MKTVVLMVICCLGLAFPHSGRTDRYGGHNNRKTGGYHYHNAGYAHAADNPYQDHTRCGICDVRKSGSVSYVDQEKKDKITFIQVALKLLGYYSGKVDGISGPGTKLAIYNLQNGNGIVATGKMDEKTKKLLLEKLGDITLK